VFAKSFISCESDAAFDCNFGEDLKQVYYISTKISKVYDSINRYLNTMALILIIGKDQQKMDSEKYIKLLFCNKQAQMKDLNFLTTQINLM
jgi:hypothetical protein